MENKLWGISISQKETKFTRIIKIIYSVNISTLSINHQIIKEIVLIKKKGNGFQNSISALQQSTLAHTLHYMHPSLFHLLNIFHCKTGTLYHSHLVYKLVKILSQMIRRIVMLFVFQTRLETVLQSIFHVNCRIILEIITSSLVNQLAQRKTD